MIIKSLILDIFRFFVNFGGKFSPLIFPTQLMPVFSYQSKQKGIIINLEIER